MEKIDEEPARFCITHKDHTYKIFSYFNATSDGSIAVHSYLDWEYTGQVELGQDFNQKTINLKNVQKSRFRVHKTNFHKSGLITKKDTRDQRYSVDICGMNFEEIKDAIMLFYIQPTFIEHYPEVQDEKHYIELTMEGREILPPIIQGYLCKKDYDFENCFISEHTDGHFFIDANILSKFNLNLYIYVRRSTDGIYPSAQAIGIFKY
jgi:hypothetical protein